MTAVGQGPGIGRRMAGAAIGGVLLGGVPMALHQAVEAGRDTVNSVGSPDGQPVDPTDGLSNNDKLALALWAATGLLGTASGYAMAPPAGLPPSDVGPVGVPPRVQAPTPVEHAAPWMHRRVG